MHWDSWLNAEVYDRFVRDREVYLWLNRRLVEIADLPGARRILDLACGTGATTSVCLRVMDPQAELVAIDASETMIRLARHAVIDPRVHFDTMAASDANRLEGPFDRVVCCAAFWQFPSARDVFRALAASTESGSRLVFNVPAERVRGEAAPIQPLQTALKTEIEAESGEPFRAQPVQVEPTTLETDAVESGFVLQDRRRLVYEGSQGELLDLMSIPAMIGPLTENLDAGGRERLLERVRQRIDTELAVEVPWVYFTFERR